MADQNTQAEEVKKEATTEKEVTQNSGFFAQVKEGITNVITEALEAQRVSVFEKASQESMDRMEKNGFLSKIISDFVTALVAALEARGLAISKEAKAENAEEKVEAAAKTEAEVELSRDEKVVREKLNLMRKHLQEKGYTISEDATLENGFRVLDKDGRYVGAVLSGGQCFSLNKDHPQSREHWYAINKCFETVNEEIKTIEQAEGKEMKFEGLPVGWKQIAAVAGIILGIKDTKRGPEYASWQQDASNGLHNGRYYKDFQQAKEDFAVRSGMVRAENLFTETQMKIILEGLVKLTGMEVLADGLVEEKEIEKFDRIVEEIRCRFPDIEIAMEEDRTTETMMVEEEAMEYEV